MKDWAYKAMHDAAMALPPSDFGSHRACEAAAELLRKERSVSDDLLTVLKRLERLLTELGAKGEPLKSIRAAISRAEGR